MKHFLSIDTPKIITSFQVLSSTLIIHTIIDYLLITQFEVLEKLPSCTAFVLLILIALPISFFNFKKKHMNFKILIISIVFLFFSTLLKAEYAAYSSYLSSMPQISNVSKNWSIQGDKIKISGKNFCNQDEIDKSNNSKVLVGDLEFIIDRWGDKEIIIKQPISSTFFTETLKVTNCKGHLATYEKFTIMNPTEVLK